MAYFQKCGNNVILSILSSEPLGPGKKIKNCEGFRLRMEKYRFLTPIPHTQIVVFPPKIKVWDLQKLRKQRDISVGILQNPTFHAVCAIEISTVRQ